MAADQPAVLIITEKFDPHADRVIERFNAAGVAFFRLNTDAFHADYKVQADGADGAIRFADRWGRSHDFPAQTRSVWHRKPIDPAPPAGVHDAATQHLILQETLEFLAYPAGDRQVPWFNNPHDNHAAARKFPQLRLAHSLGLRVPRSLVTNDPAQARAFHHEVQGQLLCKAMKAVAFGDDDANHMLFSRRIDGGAFARHVEQVALCPSLFQEYIDKAYELRITVFGEQVFCCRIDSQSVAGAQTDWRRVDPFEVPHSIVPLDPRIEAALLRVLAAYGLRFGAFDMIVTPAGEYVFLELNPNGQWLWIELITGAKLTEAMVRLLTGR